MDVIEFFKSTDHRSLKYNIDFLVKQKLEEYNCKLGERRARLKQLLASESQQYDYELNALQAACNDDKAARRIEWIGLMRLYREQDEDQLLKEKQRQRELESSEEYKDMWSRELLLDSKQAQLYQIEEKKVLKEKQLKTERDWLNAMEKLREQQNFQDFKEQKLRKCIANIDQEKNLRLKASQKAKNAAKNEELRRHYEDDNKRAVALDKKYKNDADFYEWRKKCHHKNVLERQICENSIQNAIEHQVAQVNEHLERCKIQKTILEDIDKKGAEVIQNRAFQEKYLAHIGKEKETIRQNEQEIDGVYARRGCCVLEQKEKRPYSKKTR